MKKSDLFNETAKNCWPGYRKTGTKPGTGKNKGKQVNDCEKIEEMMPKNSFAGTKKNKLGKAAHLTGKMKRPAKPGDLVGGVSEGVDLHLNEMQSNKLHVKKLLSEEEVIEHVRLHKKNLSLDNVPRTHRNIHPTICSTNFALGRTSLNESEHISAGRKLISMMQKLDQFSHLNIKLGSKVAIINYQLQGDWCELWGFTTPKTITKILKDKDDAITRFEFNNDSDDYWPRTEHAEYKGNFITNTAFFADKNSAEKALALTKLRFSDVLTIKNTINETKERMTESNSEYDDEAGMAENNLETLKRAVEGIDDLINPGDNLPEWCQEKIAVAKSMLVTVWDYMKSEENSDENVNESTEHLEKAEQYKAHLIKTAPRVMNFLSKSVKGWRPSKQEMLDAIDTAYTVMKHTGDVKIAGKAMMDELNTLHRMSQGKDLNETAAWKRKEGKNKNGGLNAKGVASYRRENPGSKLQTAVTTKPSKLDPDSKAAKRRKSFCARMGGMEGPMKDEKGDPTRKALALKKWNC
jgi:hypothetical protein